MSKQTSFTDLGVGTKKAKPDPAGPPPVSALLHTITGNPDNPRDADDMDLDDLIASFREVGQLQPVLSMSRDVFLRHKPQHAEAIGDARYVILGGNRRLEAARHLGWTRIDIQLRDDLGDDDGSIDEAVIIENIHRKALAPMREAAFLQVMVERYGSQGKVAQRIGKTQAYVSQRLSLLKLEPELQEAVDSGELKVKEARTIAAAPRAEQRAVWEEMKTPQRAEASRTHNPVMTDQPSAPGPADSFTAVKPALAPEPEPAADYHPVIIQDAPLVDDSAPAAVVVPEPRPAAVRPPVPDGMTWTDGPKAMERMRQYLLPEEWPAAIGWHLEQLGDPEAFADQLAACSSPDYRRRLAELLTKDL